MDCNIIEDNEGCETSDELLEDDEDASWSASEDEREYPQAKDLDVIDRVLLFMKP